MRRPLLFFLCIMVYSACFAGSISTNLSAAFDPRIKAVILKWQNNDAGIKKFTLQKSPDNNKWEDIYTVSEEDFSISKIEKYTDENPAAEKNFYRLTMLLEGSQAQFSSSIMVVIGQTAGSWIIFPVPVTSVLNLQYTGSEPIRGVITVIIQNQQGRILMQTRNSSLNRMIQIPVANLGKGIYSVRIQIENQTVWTQQFSK